MRSGLKLLGAVLTVSVLALVAGIGTARAEPPTPRAPTVVGTGSTGEARLVWGAVTEYDYPGGTLGDPSGLSYRVEAMPPGQSDWVLIATTTGTTYTAAGLSPGVWRFRVRGVLLGGPPGPPSPEAVKTVK